MSNLNNPPAQPVVPRHAATAILLPALLCLGLAVAAYRETFEETGVLLATTVEGHHCRADVLARVHEQRCAIVSQPELFATLLQGEHLQLDVGRLIYWAHWITPSAVSKCFDTRFFIASLLPGQSAAIDVVEASDNTMTLSQPMLHNLTELDSSMRQHASLNAMLAAEARHDVAPVLPKVAQSNPERAALDRDAMGSQISQPRRRRSVARNLLSAASSRSSVVGRQ